MVKNDNVGVDSHSKPSLQGGESDKNNTFLEFPGSTRGPRNSHWQVPNKLNTFTFRWQFIPGSFGVAACITVYHLWAI